LSKFASNMVPRANDVITRLQVTQDGLQLIREFRPLIVLLNGESSLRTRLGHIQRDLEGKGFIVLNPISPSRELLRRYSDLADVLYQVNLDPKRMSAEHRELIAYARQHGTHIKLEKTPECDSCNQPAVHQVDHASPLELFREPDTVWLCGDCARKCSQCGTTRPEREVAIREAQFGIYNCKVPVCSACAHA
jgi:hypothetical protein